MSIRSERAVPFDFEISDEDVIQAMKEIPGYLDITPSDFATLYRHAFEHALRRMVSHITVADIMTREVYSVTLDEPLARVAHMMSSRQISGVPVLDDDERVAGVISETDFLRRMADGGASFMHVVSGCLQSTGCLVVPIRTQRAADIMTTPAITVTADMTLRAVAELMTRGQINRVPVVDDDGRLAGIVSRADVVRAATETGT